MPTRRQRRRAAKGKRHEYETVWVDADGNELEEPPEEEKEVQEREPRRNGGSPAKGASKGKPAQRGARGTRTPPPPSWQRAGRRALMLGAVVFALFYLTGGKSGSNRLFGALMLAAIYTLLFIPFTFAIDRFAYARWQKRQQGGKQQPRKR